MTIILRNSQKANVAGDVVCTTEGHYCPFCFEVKSYAKIDFSHLLLQGLKLHGELATRVKNVDVLDYWSQAKRDAETVKKIPMVMMRYNGMPSDLFFIVIDMPTYLSITNKLPLPKGTKTLKYNSQEKQSLVILNSFDLFSLPYREVRKIAKFVIKHRYGKKR